MKRVLLLFLTICASNALFAHAFFFAFAEMEYNKEEKQFEISIRATGHDIEDYLAHLKTPISSLEEAKNNPLALNKIEQLITQEFIINVAEKPLKISLLGIDVGINDEVTFYLVSNKLEEPNEIEVTFFLLMNLFSEQQNKLTYIGKKEKYYFSFLTHKRTRIIALKPE